ncbi:MAG: segregation/condensation protein A, partial [Acidobacteria bacterium]
MEETAETVETERNEATPPESAPTISVAGAQPAIAADRDGDQLKITLGEFDGPLDLLLYLIRQDQVNIYDLPIARITEEYLRYLNLMQELDLTVAGDFLVMAAQLIELKSRMLLPRDPLAQVEEEEDPR